jgi:hypothetical protein
MCLSDVVYPNEDPNTTLKMHFEAKAWMFQNLRSIKRAISFKGIRQKIPQLGKTKVALLYWTTVKTDDISVQFLENETSFSETHQTV